MEGCSFVFGGKHEARAQLQGLRSCTGMYSAHGSIRGIHLKGSSGTTDLLRWEVKAYAVAPLVFSRS